MIRWRRPHADLTRSRIAPPWAVILVVLVGIVALWAVTWPGMRGPAKDWHLNLAIYTAAHNSFTPAALNTVTTLDLHEETIGNFEGIQSCPNLERLYINADSTQPWRTWADAQYTNVKLDPLTPDARPPLPTLPRLRTVKVGAPSAK